MGKGIHFDQIADVWQPNQQVRWVYRFSSDSFPAGALDEHVQIGGAYFDVLDTEYSLKPVREGTELRVRLSYRASTAFNWYARPIAEYLAGNFEEAALKFYAHRAQSSMWSWLWTQRGKRSERAAGLPPERRQRLLKVDRSRPTRKVNAEISWDFHASGVLSPAISGEESERVLRDRRVWGALQICGVTGGGEGVAGATARVPAGSQPVSGVLGRDPACFCRKMQAGIGADVYRNSTVDRASG